MHEKKPEQEETQEARTGPGLEQRLIVEFLKEKGLTMEDLKSLPPEEARKLRIEASRYATARLAELEARARFVTTIHDATHDVTD